MKTKTYRSIVAKINNHIRDNSYIQGTHYRWYVGITGDVDRRKVEHLTEEPDMRHFKAYYAYSAKIASEIEDYFAKKGTANKVGSRGANENSKLVYVYKIPLYNLYFHKP
ncbi:MAG: hypothetical protein LBU51_00380 [Bacteroidales bacterium]|jgi:hypothetical protein|nr:hypothetical protein [Bacteroidales bacterium]